MARVLVIEDDEQVGKLIREILEREGHKVAEARNGEEGLQEFRRYPADLVITDIVMPVKEGVETISDLMLEFPETKIIAISGGGRVGPETYLDLASGFGASWVIAKPFKAEVLLAAVRELLETI
jgi:DNA-binding response OmpR family regulator